MKKILLLFGLGLILTSCSLVPKLDDIGGKNNKSTDVKVNTNLQKGDNSLSSASKTDGKNGKIILNPEESGMIIIYGHPQENNQIETNYHTHYKTSIFDSVSEIITSVVLGATAIICILSGLTYLRKRKKENKSA